VPTPSERLLRFTSLEQRPSRPESIRVLLVVVVWLAALGCTMLAHPWVNGTTFAFFWVAVLFAAWTTGLWPAILLSLASVVATNWLQSPGQVLSFAIGDIIDVSSFTLAAVLVSALASRAANTTAQLRAGEARFRTLAEVSPVGIIIASDSLDSVYMNPRATEITALEAPELTAERWRELMHPLDRDTAFAENTAFREKQVQEYSSECRFLRNGTEVRWVRINARWIRDDRTGQSVAMVLALDDVSRERVLESRLQHAQKMEAVGQLAGGVAHDFNNLLTVITGSLDFLRQDLPVHHPAQLDLRQIADAVDRARQLVKQLLAFGRRQMLRPREVEVSAALHQAQGWLLRLLGDEIRCTVDVRSAEPLRVTVDPTQLDQVLLNLAMNARDAMLTPLHGRDGQGGELRFVADLVHVNDEMARDWPPLRAGDFVRLRVIDNGHGMDEVTRAKVFEPFFTTKPLGHGSGLGLATVEGIVVQSGGAIRAESRPGVGTTFTILLPSLCTAMADGLRQAPDAQPQKQFAAGTRV
jgi:two-component system, cell cycle sensor histidine kinase and response regulator CckA